MAATKPLLKNKMTSTKRLTARKWSTILGCLLIMLPIGLPWYWGNMAIYSLSYIWQRGESVEELQTPWVISLYFLFNAVGLFIVGFLSNYAGKRLTLSLGSGLFLAGVFLTYFSVKHSVMMLNLTLGFIAGVGGGMVNGIALQYAIGWAGDDLGFVTAFVQCGFNAGPVFINPFVTVLVNPDNLTPDTNLATNKFFSQPEIIDRVPSLFYYFGILCFAFHLVGFLIVREFPKKDLEEEIEINGNESVTDRTPAVLELPTENNGLPEIQTDMKPMEIIKTKTFFTLWFSLMMFDNSMLILANYYKQYGQVWVDNDFFLTFMGTVLTLATAAAFPFWGFLSDRVGVKTVLLYMYSLSSILSICMYFSPRLSRWAYMANIALAGWTLPPIFSVLIIATCKVFGKTYYSSNIGVVASLSLLVNFINPVIFEKVLEFGWFCLFCYGGCLTSVALIAIMLTLPDV